MVKKTMLDRFVKFSGYDIVKRRENGSWKNVSEASKRTGLSRPTIYAILKRYPEQPSKTLPKYVAEFRETEGYRLLKDFYEKKVTKAVFKQRVKDIRTAWKNLDKKDPISWDEQDYVKIWNMKEFIPEDLGKFEEVHAAAFHIMMELTNKHVLKEKFKGTGRPRGGKRHWFLTEGDTGKVVPCIFEVDTLMFMYCGELWGARASAMLGTKVKDVHFYDYTIQVFEPKTDQFVSKYPPIALFRLLKKYIEDFNLQPEDKLFPQSYSHYNTALGDAGKFAKLKKGVSTHILKHTFVSQGHRHRLSRETIVDMTGTEDKTIKLHYLAKDEKKIRHETQGLELEAKPFWQWVEEDIAPMFEQRYDELVYLRENYERRDGIAIGERESIRIPVMAVA